MPGPQQQAATPAPPPPDIFDTLAQQDEQKMQHDQMAAQTGDVFDQIAKNGGQPLPESTTPTQPTQKPYNPAEHGALNRFGHAFAAPFVSMYHGAVDEPQDVDEVVAHAQGGQGGLMAYRAAKQVIDAHDAMVKSSGDSFQKAAMSFKDAAISYILGNTKDAMMQGLSGGMSAVEGAQPGTSAALQRPQQLAQGAVTGGDLATPLGSTAADVAMAAGTEGLGRAASAIRGAAETGEAAEEAATASTPASESAATPKAQAVAQGTAKAAKAGISEGTAETVAPTGEEIQPQLHAGIRQFLNQTASDAGLDAIADSTPITDAPQELADSFQTRSQATFDQIEKITGIDPTALKEQMAARADQITEATASGDLEKAGKLDMLQKADENRSLQAFNQAKAQGVDVEQARSDWNASLRGDELSAAVRNSKASTSTLKNPVLDPAKLAPRLQKLAESQPGGKAPKLFQLGGEDNATTLVEHAENARDATQAIKDFVPQSATGQKLFSQIVSNNTAEKSSLLRGGNSVGVTDWNGVLKDIGNLTPAQQSALGNDLARMRQVAGRQALKQNALKALSFGTKLGVGAETLHHAVNAVSGH
jgi:hypothetical protein